MASLDEQVPKHKNEFIKLIKNIIKSEKFPFLILFLAMIILHRYINMVSDDIWFAKVTQTYSFNSYIAMRYATWTGRVSVESILYYIFKNNASIWRIVNPIIITLFTFSISRIIVGRNVLSKGENHIINWFICLGWFYISKEILNDSVFWITGSINYLWTITAMIIALIPYRDAIAKEYNGKFNIMYLILSIFASSGQEQASLIMLAFSLIISVHLIIRDKKINKYLIIQTFFIILGSLVLFLAPGNVARTHSEINTWLPNYAFYTSWEFAFYGIQWFLDGLLNHSRVIFLLLLSIVGINSYKKHKGITNGTFTLIPLFGSVLLLVASMFSMYVDMPKLMSNWVHFSNVYYSISNKLQNSLFDFYSTFNLYHISTMVYIFWIVLILLLPFYIVSILEFNSKSLYIVLIILAGICSAVAIFVSPTIYASGYRTFFPLNVLFFIVFILLLKNMQQFLKRKYLIFFSIIPVYTYTMLLLKLIQI